MKDLGTLDPSRFDVRRYAALAYVQAFLTCPRGVPAGTVAEFEARLGPEERELVMAAMKGMFCINLINNSFLALGPRPRKSCSI